MARQARFSNPGELRRVILSGNNRELVFDSGEDY